jgi:rhodanese-related sulfurtransferase
MEKEEIFVNEICPSSTQVWIKRGAILVDVREADEVAQLAYDVPNIVHIPLSELGMRYTELPIDQQLVIVCRSGARSLRVAGFLIYNGYNPEKVVNMKHGIIRWVHKGFPTKGDRSVAGPAPVSIGCCSSGAGKSDAHACSCSSAKH